MNDDYPSGDSRICSQLHPQSFTTEHIHPFGITNPKFQCFLNSILQALFPILRNIRFEFQFTSGIEGVLLKCLFETAQNACKSRDVDALKFRLIKYDSFYNGQIQQDSSECLMMLMDIMKKGSLPDSSSTFNSTGVSLTDILFSFMLEKYIVCDGCKLRSPAFESSSVLHITPTCASSMQDLILQGMRQKLQKFCSMCKKNTWHVESSHILQPPKYLIVTVNRSRYINNQSC